MREYGQVQSAFWQSCDAQAFTDHGKLLALYLLTGPHANGIGCYWLPDGYITADLGWAPKDVETAFAELSGNGLGNGYGNGFAYRFDGVVFIPKFLKWNKIANPNVASARFAELDALSNTEAKRRAARAMLEYCAHWSAPQRKILETVAQTVCQTVTQTEPNPTQPNPTQSCASPDGDAPASNDLIPYQAIVTAYNTTMANLAKVRELTTKRRTLIRSAWQASPQRRNLEFWRDAYFPECQDDAFLNGTGPYTSGHENWRPTFDYLMRPDVVTRVFERAMDRLERAQ